MLWVFGNRVMGKKFGRRMDEATRDWTKILNGNSCRGNPVVLMSYKISCLFIELQNDCLFYELHDKLSIY